MKLKKIANMPEPFGVEIYDIPLLNEMTRSEWRELGKICLQHLVWIIPNQNISKHVFARIAYSWGKPGLFTENDFNQIQDKKIKNEVYDELIRMSITNLPGLARVTGIKTEDGKATGMFSDGELDWHSNESGKENPHPVVLLHGISGTKNSQTQFLENVTKYEKLTTEDKLFFDSLECIYHYNGTNIYSDVTGLSGVSATQNQIVRINTYASNEPFIKKLVLTSPGGFKGFAFNFNTFHKFVDKTEKESNEIKEWLKDLLIVDKDIYTHNWEDGDIIAFDQIVTLHRRPTKDCSNRLLHRISCDFSKISL